MTIVYGEQVKGDQHVHYVVQAIWPQDVFGKPGIPDPRRETWGSYQSTAWNDKAAPNTKRDGYGRCEGNFDIVHADVAEHPSRVGKAKYDAPVFTDPVAARAYSDRLEACGEVAARFGDGGTQEDRDKNYSSRVIRSRVVEQSYAKLERVVLRP